MSTLLWLRRDLRVHDNPALNKAIESGATTALYISAPTQWQDHHLAPIQADFIKRHLNLLKQQLASFGIALIHLAASNYKTQSQVLRLYCEQHHITQVFANRESEINEIKRDNALQDTELNLTLFESDIIAPRGTILNKQGQMFKVFTPFKKAWLSYVQTKGIDFVSAPTQSNNLAHLHSVSHASTSTKQSTLQKTRQTFEFDYPQQDSSAWPLSDHMMTQVLPHFLQHKVQHYGDTRDIPAIKGTSGLSPYFTIGAISPRFVATQLIQAQPEILLDPDHAQFPWLNELIWRDFYKHLLFHFPTLSQGQCFQRHYQHLPWLNSMDHFNAWCQAKTGYPLVDAAMRQLLKTGWMHNRLRMIVASFLTKHLLIDWRWGEQFFMSHLIDGDLSANNGGWQWAASTGCDAQPYFRIFNPITQSQKFDPNGAFIRRYLPELDALPNEVIHFPHEYLAQHPNLANYWPPLVDHKQARLRALDFFKRGQQ
ncbi:deoxyribodipyrimidine photo-lyase [uncultured Shewanella sp.]|uniref:deoxyribodipyrimidine photo-lyase n=1 Tax=uncultured Shewanella sp. TaxID=173975 RepID=UPI002604D4D2|nr:deoxyribodipyrimidine photo-lyase [uncultured Shewanella sp.]